MLGGYYIIRNVKKALPGSSTLACFERHKSVNVECVLARAHACMLGAMNAHLFGLRRIESESPDPSVDSRRIVKLAIVATDVPVQTTQPPL